MENGDAMTDEAFRADIGDWLVKEKWERTPVLRSIVCQFTVGTHSPIGELEVDADIWHGD